LKAFWCRNQIGNELVCEAGTTTQRRKFSCKEGIKRSVLAKSGKRAEAQSEVEQLVTLSKQRYVSPYNIALIYVALDQRNEAFEWLEKAYQQRDPLLIQLRVEPKWTTLRSDPRFQDLLRRIGFPS